MKQTQRQAGEWQDKNFPNSTADDMFKGIVEEVGELSHVLLKSGQGLLGADAVDKERDAIGDILIFLMNYCTKRGYCIQTILAQTWERVQKRDYNKRREQVGNQTASISKDHDGVSLTDEEALAQSGDFTTAKCCCPAMDSRYRCTRVEGHIGEHIASGPTHVILRWPNIQ